jgi:hypothetical protein
MFSDTYELFHRTWDADDLEKTGTSIDTQITISEKDIAHSVDINHKF